MQQDLTGLLETLGASNKPEDEKGKNKQTAKEKKKDTPSIMSESKRREEKSGA